jgi:DNA-binding PadR family transcriptional regulator
MQRVIIVFYSRHNEGLSSKEWMIQNGKKKKSFHYTPRGRRDIGQIGKKLGTRVMVIFSLHGNI